MPKGFEQADSAAGERGMIRDAARTGCREQIGRLIEAIYDMEHSVASAALQTHP
jgi:hypothetical protein